jgi:DNA-binding protein H-NS
LTKLLTESEAADFLRMKPQTLAVWRGQGRGPQFQKLCGRIVYSETKLEAWIEQNTRRSTSKYDHAGA